jgi:Tol biopolymer transport system component
MREIATGRVTLVSASASGVAANAAIADTPPDQPRPFGVSLDGRYVVFASSASNLVGSDSNGSRVDVFRKDTLTGRVTIVSRDSAGAQPSDGVTGQPSVSADGARVAFASGDQPLVPADANGVGDIYLADLRAASLTLVSRSASGAQSTRAVDHPALSADGRSVAFHGTREASVLAAGDTDSQDDVYVAQPHSRTIVVASLPTGGTDTGPSGAASISGDGTRVAFESEAPLAPGDSGASPDAYVRDLTSGTTRRVSGSDISGGPVISVNGARVAFAGAATGADAGDVNGVDDVYVRTLSTNALYRASRDASGNAPATAAGRPAISGSGSLVAFTVNDQGSTRADSWATDVGTIAATAPGLTATATHNGRRVTVAGTASDPAGITSVSVGRRTARISDDGGYSVSFTAPLGTEAVTVTATSGLGATATAQVGVTRARAPRGTSPAAPRPRALRVRVARPWARASFSLPVRAAWRVELRQRVQGTSRARAFRLIAARSGAPVAGRRTVRLRLPTTIRPGRYQVRVMMSSASGLGTSARTITVP